MTAQSVRNMNRHITLFQVDGCAGVLARKMKPTLNHRPAMWGGILGTVYAMNNAGEVRYFDYKWSEALDFSGARTEAADPRWAKMQQDRMRQGYGEGLRAGRSCLWVKKEEEPVVKCRCRKPRRHSDCSYCGAWSSNDAICGVCKEAGIDGHLIPGTGRLVCSSHRGEVA